MSWNRTQFVERRLEDQIKDGKYAGRPIIRMDSRIDGGVYLGAVAREAIVVDSEKDEILMEVYHAAIRRCSDDEGVDRSLVIRTVYDSVLDNMKYNNAAVQEMTAKYELDNDGRVALGMFIREGIGVCRHMGLLAGFLLEKFIDDEYIRGKVSVDRRSLYMGGHGWCRYVNSKGTTLIIDPAQKFMGTLEQAMEKYCRFYYAREEELKKILEDALP